MNTCQRIVSLIHQCRNHADVNPTTSSKESRTAEAFLGMLKQREVASHRMGGKITDFLLGRAERYRMQSNSKTRHGGRVDNPEVCAGWRQCIVFHRNRLISAHFKQACQLDWKADRQVGRWKGQEPFNPSGILMVFSRVLKRSRCLLTFCSRPFLLEQTHPPRKWPACSFIFLSVIKVCHFPGPWLRGN